MTTTTWQRVDALLEEAITLLSSDADAPAFVEAAKRWCAVAPEPKLTDVGSTYVCFPRETLALGERSFTLEISPTGVVGMQMDELDEATSRELAAAARGTVGALCAVPFVAAPGVEGRASAFHTCPVDGGSTLAVGHARATNGPGWFVSVTVLGQPRRVAAP